MKDKFIELKIEVINDLKKGVKKTREYCLNTSYPVNEILLLEGRITDTKKLYNRGEIGVDKYEVNLTQIKSSLLQLIDDISKFEIDTDDLIGWWENLPYEWEKIFHPIIGENPNRKKIEYLLSRTSISIDSNEIVNLEPLQRFKSLEEIFIISSSLEDLSSLRSQKDLRVLILKRLPSLRRIEKLYLNEIETIEVYDCGLNDLSFIGDFSKVYSFYIYNTPVEDISYIEESPIEYLRLVNTKVSDISSLQKLSYIDELHLIGEGILDLSPLSELTIMSILKLKVNRSADIQVIKKLSRLNDIEIKSPAVKSLDLFNGLRLYELSICYSKESISIDDLYKFGAINPGCRFSYRPDE